MSTTWLIKKEDTTFINALVVHRLNKGGKPASYTPDQLAALAEEWKEIVIHHTVKVDTGKTDTKSSAKIIVDKPEPPIIESFIGYIGVSWETWSRWLNGEMEKEKYREIARDLKEFCNMMVLRYSFLGLISERSAIFYLVNNSRYQDKAEVVQTVQQANKPAWLDKNAGRLDPDEAEDIEHTNI